MGSITFSNSCDIQATDYGLCLGFVNQPVPYRSHIWFDAAKTTTLNTRYWGQVSVGTEYQVILCINRECSGKVVVVSLE